MIRKLLVANRGEIALRVFRTAREMGLATVAVYSDADEAMPHVMAADEAVRIGPSEPRSSYLNIDTILLAAKQTGADAIHPGYGFLSERPEFAEACRSAGIVFVGPSPEAMKALGSKAEAKALAHAAGVPIVPGAFDTSATDEELAVMAAKIGYPVMLKASAGGGGRGMRVVRDPHLFHQELALARDEALKAFGDGTMLVEKLIERPRHIEVQVLADRYGNVACLFERECSIQRRHQKLVEESPTPLWASDASMWDPMCDAARNLVRTARYSGAGTVEFIVDESAVRFYFLEVNARLQVEHPVTEWITGQDLVRSQIRIASGEPLDLPDGLMAGDRRSIVGHAIEVRIVAEDPASGFLPSVGKIAGWAEPRGPGIRVDTGYGQGTEVGRFYDSLLAKVIVHGPDRASAIERLKAALLDFHVLGVETNIAYLLDLLEHPDVEAGRLDTGLLEREFAAWTQGPLPEELADIVAAAIPARGSAATGASIGAWALGDRFRNARTLR